LFLALTLGDRTELESSVAASFSRTGTAHLLAISGLHVGMCWLGARLILQRLLSFWGGRWVRRGGAIVGASVLAWGVAATYVLAAGAPVSGLRALGMLGAVTLAGAGRMRPSPWNVLAFGVMTVVAGDPASVKALGFQLSVASVACLIAATAPVDDGVGRWGTLVRAARVGLWTGLIGTCATAPLVGRTWGQVPIAGIWSNVVAVPLLGAATLPPLLLGSVLSAVHPRLGGGLVSFAGFTAGLGLDLVTWLAAPERAPQLAWEPSVMTTVTLYGGGLFLMLRGRTR
jgi:competence protein ComEC